MGLDKRLPSALIDVVILFFAQMVLGLVGGVLGMKNMTSSIAPLLSLAYFIYMEGTTGQTIGKKTMKIKVVREDGKPMDYQTAAIRNIVGIVDYFFVGIIGIILIASDAKRQRLGDKIAKTVVVSA